MNKKVQQKHNQIKNRMGRLTDKDLFLSQSYHGTMLKSVRLLGQKNDITLFMKSPMTPGLRLQMDGSST